MADEALLKMIAEWEATSRELAAIKKKEMDLRNAVVMLLSPAEPLSEGTHNFPIADGWGVKVEQKFNRTLDERVLPTVLEQMVNFDIYPEQLIEYKPKLNMRYYRKLPESAMRVFDEALTIKPGTPAISVIKPKGQS